MFYEEKLFCINTGRGGFSAGERAGLITERLKELYEKYRDMDVDNIRVVKYDTGVYVVYDGTKETEDNEGKLENIMMVDEEEAKIAGLKTQAMGEEYAKKIREAITVHRKETSLKSIILGVVYTLIVTAILIFIFIISGKFLKTAEKLLNTWEGILIKDFKIQKLTVFTSERIVHAIIVLLNILIFIIRIIAIYIYLALTLSFFIWTKEISDKQLDYTLGGLKIAGIFILSYLPNFFVIFLTVIITYYIIKIIYFIFNALDKGYITFPGFYGDWAMPTYKIVRFLFIVLAIIIIYPYLPGSETSAFRGISVFIGLLLSLGSSSAVSNIIAGIILTYMNAFKIGDRVKISDTTGDIIDRTLLVTHIRTIKNVDITIPNSMILSNHITNYSSSSKDLGLILNTTVTMGYDIPWRKIHKTLIDAALITENILSEPTPFILQTSLDDNYVSYELNAYTNEANKMQNIYAELHQNIQDKCNENNIEILSPHYRAIRDGNHVTIPEAYLPKDYKPQFFRITSIKENKEEKAENKKKDRRR